MIIDATNLIVGRMGTFVAKKALLGEEISILNCDRAVITGEKARILADYKRKKERGSPLVGPFFPRQADRFVKRTIRGMLPYKQPKGRAAFDRIKCYIGVPSDFQNKKLESISQADVSKVLNAKHLSVKDVCKFLGGKSE
jgi:large subunit ribosomal protein L13